MAGRSGGSAYNTRSTRSNTKGPAKKLREDWMHKTCTRIATEKCNAGYSTYNKESAGFLRREKKG